MHWVMKLGRYVYSPLALISVTPTAYFEGLHFDIPGSIFVSTMRRAATAGPEVVFEFERMIDIATFGTSLTRRVKTRNFPLRDGFCYILEPTWHPVQPGLGATLWG